MYHINAVDEVTQWQVVGAVAAIAQSHLEPVLQAILAQFPFPVRGFHSDNGSEFINQSVADLLQRLLIEQTKSQHRPAGTVPDQYVFQESREALDDRGILRQVIRPAAKELRFYFESSGWHSFRRQNITVLQAGHSRPAMTSECTIVGFERSEQAVRRLQERLLLGLQPVVLGVN